MMVPCSYARRGAWLLLFALPCACSSSAREDAKPAVLDAGESRPMHDSDQDACAEEACVPATTAPAPHDAGASVIEHAASAGHSEASSQGDAAPTSAGGTGAKPAVLQGTRYPSGAVHSPLTQAVVTHVRTLIERGGRRTTRFSKLGDINCMYATFGLDPNNALRQVPVPGLPQGTQAAVQYFLADHFSETGAAPRSSFAREGACLESGTAGGMLEGKPSVLEAELAASGAAFTTLMLGGVETGGGDRANLRDELAQITNFAPAFLEIVDRLLAQGTVPLIRAFPSRVWCSNCLAASAGPGCSCAGGPYGTNHLAGLFVTVVRAIAEGRMVPFADNNAALAAVGSKPGDYTDGDNGHLSNNHGDPCDFSDMKRGAPTDNLLLLQQLERMRQIVTNEVSVEPEPGPGRQGSGSAVDPFVMDVLPFTELRSLQGAAAPEDPDWSSCGASAHVRRALYYRIEVPRSTALRVLLVNKLADATPAFLRYFKGSLDLDSCKPSADDAGRYDTLYALTLSPGTHYFAVASSNAAPAEDPDEFVLVAQPCPDGDPRCAVAP